MTQSQLAGSARLGALLFFAALLAGCAADQIRVTPAPSDLATKNPGKGICIVTNPNVAVADFLENYRAALQSRGYSVRVVQGNPQVSACPFTSRYVAYANGFANIDLYWEGQPVGTGMHSSAAISNQALGVLVSRLLP